MLSSPYAIRYCHSHCHAPHYHSILSLQTDTLYNHSTPMVYTVAVCFHSLTLKRSNAILRCPCTPSWDAVADEVAV